VFQAAWPKKCSFKTRIFSCVFTIDERGEDEEETSILDFTFFKEERNGLNLVA
jgi:hypothetical protein